VISTSPGDWHTRRRRCRVGARLLSLVGIGTGNWGARDCRRDSCSAQYWCDVFQSDLHSGTHFDG
jgi:hypothetical protein